MKCPRCQTENPEMRKFCRECGAKLLQVCPQCGSENLPGIDSVANFARGAFSMKCPHCQEDNPEGTLRYIGIGIKPPNTKLGGNGTERPLNNFRLTLRYPIPHSSHCFVNGGLSFRW